MEGKEVQEMRESKIESYAVKIAKQKGFMAVKYKDESRNGGPDHLFLGPSKDIFWIEFKRLGEKPKPHQLKYHDMLRSLGFEVYVIDCKEDVDELFGI
ncbi:MAG: VRR-NUC domain-containing protein [Candidatus Thorarchaeota archaeon]